MKTATVLTVLLGVWGVGAAVVAESAQHHEDKRLWCKWRGQSCWKVKRAAEAFADAIRSSGDLTTRDAAADPAHLAARDLSNLPGGAAFNAKRAADALASAVASTQDDPDVFYNALFLDEYFHPDTEAKPAAAPAAADTKEAKEAKRDLDADKRWCNSQGRACWTAKRAAAALVSAIEGFEAEAKRDLSSSSASDRQHQDSKRQWCKWHGQSCWKRDVAFEPIALGGRDVSRAEGGREDKRQWCKWRGQSCWKRDEVSGLEARCHSPSGPCTKAQRDLRAIELAARDVLASLE